MAAAGLGLLATAWVTQSETAMWGAAVALSVLIVASLFAVLSVRGLELVVWLPRGLHSQVDRGWSVRVSQTSRWPSFGAQLDLALESTLTLTASPLPSVSRGVAITLELPGRCKRRGRFHTLTATVREAPLGLVQAARTWTLRTDVTVYPAVEILQRPEVPAGSPRTTEGTRSIDRSGQDTELLGLREYAPGDSPRLVHWVATARAGKVLVKDLARSSQADVVVALDLSQPGRPWPDAAHEDLVSVASSVALHLDRRSLRTSLVVTGPRPLSIKQGSGDRHRAGVLEALTMAVSGPGPRLASVLARSLVSPGPETTLVLVGPRSSLDVELRGQLELLRKLGVKVCLVLLALEHYREEPRLVGLRAPVAGTHIPMPGSDSGSGPLMIYVPGRPLGLASLLGRLG